VAGLLLRWAYGAEAAGQIAVDDYGKPWLASPAADPGRAHFSVSHSGDYVALLLDAVACGVDVEWFGGRAAGIGAAGATAGANTGGGLEGVARRFTAADERAFLFRDGAFDEPSFYKVWVAKESIMKAAGKGIGLSPASFSVLPLTDGVRFADGRHWRVCWLDGLPGYGFAAAFAAENASNGDAPRMAPLPKIDLLR